MRDHSRQLSPKCCKHLAVLQVLLDRSGCGLVRPQDLLAAAHAAVAWQVGICPKPKVDINDVLLQLALPLKQEQLQQQADCSRPRSPASQQSLVSLVSRACLLITE